MSCSTLWMPQNRPYPSHPGSKHPERVSVCNLVASGEKTSPDENVPKVHGIILHYTEHYSEQGLLSCGLSAGRNHSVTSTAEAFNS